jgi:hypothetical protein
MYNESKPKAFAVSEHGHGVAVGIISNHFKTFLFFTS